MTETTEAGRHESALLELARDDVERKKFLKMAGRRMGAGTAAAGLSAFIAACGGSSKSSSSSSSSSASATVAGASTTRGASGGDLGIVNYALTLEYLEAQFYDKVIQSGLFSGRNLAVIKEFGAEEHQHVAALKTVASSLGTPATEPTGKFPLKNAASVTKLAAAVENLGAAAYLGQAGNIKSKEILAAALSIHSVEARHAATIDLVLRRSPTPDGAFGVPMTMDQVLKVVKPFIA
jgi:hypothetical protein